MFSIVLVLLIFVAVFIGDGLSGDALIITSGLFAVAGSIGTVAFNMRKKDEDNDEDIKDEWDMFNSDD